MAGFCKLVALVLFSLIFIVTIHTSFPYRQWRTIIWVLWSRLCSSNWFGSWLQSSKIYMWLLCVTRFFRLLVFKLLLLAATTNYGSLALEIGSLCLHKDCGHRVHHMWYLMTAKISLIKTFWAFIFTSSSHIHYSSPTADVWLGAVNPKQVLPCPNLLGPEHLHTRQCGMRYYMTLIFTYTNIIWILVNNL